MGTKEKVEACGRCAMSTVMGATEGNGTNPFEGDRIEIEESELAAVSKHVVAASRLKERLNAWAREFTYGR